MQCDTMQAFENAVEDWQGK